MVEYGIHRVEVINSNGDIELYSSVQNCKNAHEKRLEGKFNSFKQASRKKFIDRTAWRSLEIPYVPVTIGALTGAVGSVVPNILHGHPDKLRDVFILVSALAISEIGAKVRTTAMAERYKADQQRLALKQAELEQQKVFRTSFPY